MEPEHRDDWGDDVRRRLDEAKGLAEDRKEEFQESSTYKGWKGLTSAQRFYIVGGALFVVMLVAYLLFSYWDVPQVPGPSGEGG